uniref:Translation initiation factor IF-2, chloroplastic n=2 Tax=Gelidium TaxID=2811 RepID=A0A411FT22_9FLOR|nr:translation initiation factor 2 [Gelidium coulteri]YP_009565208.1 translation initiation factor 2 [Gelidium sinicola]QBA96159.1 translation initiation factor 2 [Gelidium coulteri]QBA96559.1 translation initiation factor 2 [Gelidium sinicola]
MQHKPYFKVGATINNNDIIWNLTKPKLIDFLREKKNTKLNIKDFNVNSIDSKFYKEDKEKKYKTTAKIDSEVDIKKNKSKFKKKSRTRIDIKDKDLFVDNTTNNLLNGNEINKSLIKSHKLSRKKKKSKIETSSLINLTTNSEADSSYSDNINLVCINHPLTIYELSSKLKIPETEIITNLFLKGISVTINQVIDISIATELAESYNFEVVHESSKLPVKFDAKVEDSVISSLKPPVITIFGHVDHGKTTLLNTIVKSTAKEAGGITQAINSYEIDWPYYTSSRKLIFLDTPGHEAFFRMRSLSAQVTDIAILVVAADDGLKKQTIEAIEHIVNCNLRCVVAITKVDKQDIEISKLKEQLAKHGIVDESWGGNYPIIEVSAVLGKNIDFLLSTICSLSDMQDLKVNLEQLGSGVILESHLDKQRGYVASIIVKNGIVKQGDIIIADNHYGKIKLITGIKGVKQEQILPSSVAEILGFQSVVQVGTTFNIAKTEKEAKCLIEKKLYQEPAFDITKILNTRVTLEGYNNPSLIKQLNIILKTDTQGSVEALIYAFSKISQDKVQINVLNANSGEVSQNDLQLASSTGALIVCFNRDISTHLKNLSHNLRIVIKNFQVIYDLIDYVENSMINLLDIEYDKVLVGEAIIQTVFSMNKGSVAGCLVLKGKLEKNSWIEVYHNKNLVHEGKLDSLKHLKDDVNQVHEGNECGVLCKDYNLWMQKGIIKAYNLQEKLKEL